jgi:glucan phosphorylase
VVWTRRITPYKRLDTLGKMLRTPEWRERFLRLNIVLFIGGRIHQQDNHAQDIVYDLFDLLEKDEALQQRIIFVDNFNVWEAPLIYMGSDGSIMLADDTREASATGFMKAQVNGSAIIATADGAVPEFVVFPEQDGKKVNGFNVPYINGEPTPEGLLHALEAYDAAHKNSADAAAIMRAALAETSQVSVTRTVSQMKQLYEQVLDAPVAASPRA